MNVKIFSTPYGHIIGEVISEDLESENCVRLRNPGAVQVLQSQQGIQFVIGEIVPPFYANQSDLLDSFPIHGWDIAFEGKPDLEMAERYKKYAEKLIERRSGIQIVGKGALDRIKQLGGRLVK